MSRQVDGWVNGGGMDDPLIGWVDRRTDRQMGRWMVNG